MLFNLVIRACIVILFTTLPAWADKLIIEPDMGPTPIIQAINKTHHSIDLAMYGFTDNQILNPLLQQKQQGKTIKIILEQSPYKAADENQKTITLLKQHKIAWIGSVPPFRLIHQKTLVVDDKQAIVMTFNFTHSTFKNERNFAIIIDDPTRVREIESVFNADWNHKAITPVANDLIWSPDNSRDKFIALIASAKQSIKIYQQNVSDYKIVGALAKAARKGVTIQLLTAQALRAKQANYLTKAGVNLKQNKKYYIHAKALVIDGKKAVIGSINFTKSSLDNNRELSVITDDATVVKQLSATFDSDW